MNCKICKNLSIEIFNAIILNKYEVKYYQCPQCKFIQTEEPFWLEEAYDEAIASVDTGYVSRNIDMSSITNSVIKYFFSSKKKFLDFGGGYGLFVRLMRDKGYDYYLNDQFCQNIFVKHFESKEIGNINKFELITAFEVFEHIPNPIENITKLLQYSDSILFSTSLIPSKKINNISDWWYFVPETGQHVSLYSLDALKSIASNFDSYLYSNGRNLHIISKKRFFLNPIKLISYFYYIKKFSCNYLRNRESRIISDFELIKHNIRNNN